jgi:hypothetical protein
MMPLPNFCYSACLVIFRIFCAFEIGDFNPDQRQFRYRMNLTINQLAKFFWLNFWTVIAFLTIFVALFSHKVCLSCMKKISEGCTESYLPEGSETCGDPYYLSDEASSYMDSDDDSADEVYVPSPVKRGSKSNPLYREQKRKRIVEEEVGCFCIHVFRASLFLILTVYYYNQSIPRCGPVPYGTRLFSRYRFFCVFSYHMGNKYSLRKVSSFRCNLPFFIFGVRAKNSRYQKIE